MIAGSVDTGRTPDLNDLGAAPETGIWHRHGDLPGLRESRLNRVVGNHVAEALREGFALSHSGENTIRANEVLLRRGFVGHGIHLSAAHNNTIVRNWLHDNLSNGAVLMESNDSRITFNGFSANGAGVRLVNSAFRPARATRLRTVGVVSVPLRSATKT